jgi:hypothetical protein
MLSPRAPSNTLTGAVLGVCGFLSNAGLPASSAHAQDRIFAFASGFRTGLTPREAPPLISKAQLRFSRELPADTLSMRALKASLDDPSALRISWGSLDVNQNKLNCEVQLNDGSSISLSIATISPCRLSRTSLLVASGDGYRCDIPNRSVRSIRPSPSVEYDLAWNELCSEKTADDLLAIRRPSGALDTMRGVATALSSEDIEFLIDGETYRVPFRKIEGVVFADTANNKTPPEQIDAPGRSYLFTAGSRLVCSRMDIDLNRESALVAETLSGALITIKPGNPFIFDRTEQLALTPNAMKATSNRSFNNDAYTRALPLGERLLTLAPHSHSIVGEGLDTRLRVFGPSELQIEVPAGSYLLVFDPLLLKPSPVPFEIYLEDARSSARTLAYSTDPSATSQTPTTPQGDYRVTGPGRISIVVPSEEQVDFGSFLLVPER